MDSDVRDEKKQRHAAITETRKIIDSDEVENEESLLCFVAIVCFNLELPCVLVSTLYSVLARFFHLLKK